MPNAVGAVAPDPSYTSLQPPRQQPPSYVGPPATTPATVTATATATATAVVPPAKGLLTAKGRRLD